SPRRRWNRWAINSSGMCARCFRSGPSRPVRPPTTNPTLRRSHLTMTRRKLKPSPSPDSRERLLEHFQTLRIPVSSDELDAALAQAEKLRWSALELLARLIGPQADQRRERAIERRIREARFHEPKVLEGFDWLFNARAIDRARIESLAAGEFVRRG